MYRVYCDSYLIFDTRKSENLKILNPKVSLELNKTGSFTFTIYPSHPHYDKLRKLKSIITVYQDDYLLFRGRILNDEQGFYNEKQVTCEGELAFLVDSIQRPYDFMTGDLHTTVSELFTFFINNHNSQVEPEHQFKVGNITVTDPNDYIVRSDSTYLNTWDSIQKKLIEGYGGYLWIRHEPDGNYIDYLADFDTISNQKIEFGKNLLDINRITKGEDIATAIIPLGAKISEETDARLTIESVNDGVDYVFNQDAVDLYGWIFKTVTWDDVTIADNLLRKGNEALASAINLSVSIELNAVDLAAIDTDISAFHMGTYVKVLTNPHGLNSNFLVTKLSIDLANLKSNKLTLGKSYSTFTEQTSSTTKNYSQAIQKIDRLDAQYSTIQADVLEQASSAINQSATAIMQQVSEDYYLKSDADALVESVNTKFTQTNNDFEFQFNKFLQDIQDVQNGADAQFQEIRKYIRFIDGDIVLGEDGNELTLKIQNDRISFLQSGLEVAYFSNKKLYVTDGEYLNSLKIGSYSFLPRANGNLSFKKVT